MESRSRRMRRRDRLYVPAVLLLLAAAVCAGVLLATLVNGAGRADASAGRNTAAAGTGTPAQTDDVEAARFGGSLEAVSAVLVDGEGNALYSLNADEKRYPASMTKVMTALLALEYGNLDDVVRVGDEANLPKPGSSKAGLRYGEKLTVAQLLDALLVPSGNDAAYVVAAYVGRKAGKNSEMGVEEAVFAFVGLMNRRAGELGAAHTRFVNPDGYHDDGHYTSAGDMARIAVYAMNNREFRRIVAKVTADLPSLQDGDGKREARAFANTNRLLDSFGPWYLKDCTGIKTGHTDEAGYCLLSSAEAGGASVIAVVMGSTEEGVWKDSSALLRWGLEAGRR